MLVNGVRVPEYIHENDVKKIVLPGDKIQHTIKRNTRNISSSRFLRKLSGKGAEGGKAF